jgi:cation:H+ antiporter
LDILSDKVIFYSTELSSYFRLSHISAGFILLSVTTSLPELFVSGIASFIGEGGISIGNVLGSNIANLTIIIGLSILLTKNKIRIKAGSGKALAQFLFLSSLIPVFILQKGSLGPILGVVLLVLFVYFTLNISKKAAKVTPLKYIRRKELRAIVLKFLICCFLLIILSKLIVDNSILVAQYLGIPTTIVGATLIAIGTSLPELATTLQALRRNLYEMALGNLLGSCITNLTLVLGLSALLSFSSINILATGSMLFFVLLSTLTIWYLINTRKYLKRSDGIILCFIYLLFILQQVGFSLIIF